MPAFAALAPALLVCAALGPSGVGPAPVDAGPPAAGGPASSHRDQMVRIRRVPRSPQMRGGPAIEVEVTSPRPFPVMGVSPVMRIGGREFLISRYPPDGDLHTLIFTLSLQEFEATRSGEPIFVQYGRSGGPGAPAPRPDLIWSFGRLQKPAESP